MKRRILPKNIQEKIASFPEYSYGAHKVTLILSDGCKISDVYIGGNDEIIRVGAKEKINFDPDQVVDVKSEV